MNAEETIKPTPGRPKGQKNPAGHGAGRPAAVRSDAYHQRLQVWQQWYKDLRPRSCTAAVLAERINSTAGTIANYARAGTQPSETTLGNLERICSAYGYQPPTPHHQLL